MPWHARRTVCLGNAVRALAARPDRPVRPRGEERAAGAGPETRYLKAGRQRGTHTDILSKWSTFYLCETYTDIPAPCVAAVAAGSSAMSEDSTTEWAAALSEASSVLSDLDESHLEGASHDGKATWRLVEILLEKMQGSAIPFEDRNNIQDKWRKVLIVAKQGQPDAELCTASGAVLVGRGSVQRTKRVLNNKTLS